MKKALFFLTFFLPASAWAVRPPDSSTTNLPSNDVGTTQIINSTVGLVDLNTTDVDTRYLTTGTAQTISAAKTFSGGMSISSPTITGPMVFSSVVIATAVADDSVADATWSTMTWNESMDSANEFNGSTFTATYAGQYLIGAACAFNGTTPILLGIRAISSSGGVPYNEFSGPSSTGGGVGTTAKFGPFVFTLAAGETVRFEMYQDSAGATAQLGGTTYSWLSIIRVR